MGGISNVGRSIAPGARAGGGAAPSGELFNGFFGGDGGVLARDSQTMVNDIPWNFRGPTYTPITQTAVGLECSGSAANAFTALLADIWPDYDDSAEFEIWAKIKNPNFSNGQFWLTFGLATDVGAGGVGSGYAGGGGSAGSHRQGAATWYDSATRRETRTGAVQTSNNWALIRAFGSASSGYRGQLEYYATEPEFPDVGTDLNHADEYDLSMYADLDALGGFNAIGMILWAYPGDSFTLTHMRINAI